MGDNVRRSRSPSGERANPVPQWEVFVRSEETRALKHVGSVSATSETEAHEHASRLFGWFAVDIWLCPAADVRRYTARGLADESDDVDAHAADGVDGTDPNDPPKVSEP
ncbi:Htur_1727 family rSAM-partnered candidate RiPP [Natrialbaceae archaeon GCM10025810]|uniref:Htur_1727 family rSAM-partnered candidate RiPP n=1 Tax=Halovalidus salilacus TaxID=3075124 RepID=UPI003621855D